ncbi:MAG TPA: hypothetical protein VIT44_14465 [Cyclobacteriaceae bacterium]
MRITIDYNPTNNDFSVLVDRGTLSNGWPPLPPPPPSQMEFVQVTSWLNESFATCLKKFEDEKVAAVRYKYEPKNNIQKEFVFRTEESVAPEPPPFIK